MLTGVFNHMFSHSNSSVLVVGDIYFVNDNVCVMQKESLMLSTKNKIKMLMLATFSSNISHLIFPYSLAFLKKSNNFFFSLGHINEPMKDLLQVAQLCH